MGDASRETRPPETADVPRQSRAPDPPPAAPEMKQEAHDATARAARVEYLAARAHQAPEQWEAERGAPRDADVSAETHSRIAELEGEGHGPGRHLYPSDAELQARLGTPVYEDGVVKTNAKGFVISENKVDPMVGPPSDGTHKCGPIATRFDSPADFVAAEKYMREEVASKGGVSDTVDIETVLGPEAARRMTGFYIDPADPSEYRKVDDFTGGTIFVLFDRDTNGDLTNITMYCNPAPFTP